MFSISCSAELVLLLGRGWPPQRGAGGEDPAPPAGEEAPFRGSGAAARHLGVLFSYQLRAFFVVGKISKKLLLTTYHFFFF